MRVRESRHTVMIVDKKYLNIDTGKYDSEKIPPLFHHSLSDFMIGYNDHVVEPRQRRSKIYKKKEYPGAWFTPKDDDFDEEERRIAAKKKHEQEEKRLMLEEEKKRIEAERQRVEQRRARQEQEEIYQKRLLEVKERLAEEGGPVVYCSRDTIHSGSTRIITTVWKQR